MYVCYLPSTASAPLILEQLLDGFHNLWQLFLYLITSAAFVIEFGSEQNTQPSVGFVFIFNEKWNQFLIQIVGIFGFYNDKEKRPI